MSTPLFLNLHKVTVRIDSESELLRSWILFDFASFLVSDSAVPVDVTVVVSREPISLPKDPPLIESGRGAGLVAFDSGHLRYVLYDNSVLAVFDRSREHVEFRGDSPELLYEKLFLFILSRSGELLEGRGLHRVHALGVSRGGKGLLYLMPMGGGKSTLALELVRKEGCRLISDDSPLVDYRGNLYPFPLRIGGADPTLAVSPTMRRTFVRSHRAPKVVLHPDALGDVWEKDSVPCQVIVLGRWTTASVASISPVSRISLFKKLFRDLVLGYGIAQVLEFFLASTWSDCLKKSALVVRRMRACLGLLWRARGYELRIPCQLPSQGGAELLVQLLE